MSKSKGNIIDPLELIDQLRRRRAALHLCALTGPGRDIKLGAGARGGLPQLRHQAVERRAVLRDERHRAGRIIRPARATLPLTRWILDALNRAIEEATAALEAYRFDEYAAACYRFTWDTFCDWFVEFAKPALAESEVRATAAYVLGAILRLLHPHAVRHGGTVGPLRLRRAVQPDPDRVARAKYSAGRRGGARRTGLGRAPDLRGALGPHRDERASRHADADTAARCRARDRWRAAQRGWRPSVGSPARLT